MNEYVTAHDVRYTPELARICADITGDGHLQLQDWRGLTSFYAKDIEDIHKMNKRFENVFGVSGRIYRDDRNGRTRYKLFFISKKAAQELARAGVPTGNKTNKPFSVPDWILAGDEAFQAAYLRGLFTAEGSIFSVRQSGNRVRWQISIEMYKRTDLAREGIEYMQQVKQMLQDLGIVSSPVRLGRRNKRIDGTESIAVRLDVESRSFYMFHEKVSFDCEQKAAKLLTQVRMATFL
ncbi:LAGLIDADG family homing endonuclease [Candidatus Woesearchaeota archaeon]|nr:LAGLIDADG family homing endonuclease [Candidatus Woesearchaeota archaeon]